MVNRNKYVEGGKTINNGRHLTFGFIRTTLMKKMGGISLQAKLVTDKLIDNLISG